jgi:hypothetical protein
MYTPWTRPIGALFAGKSGSSACYGQFMPASRSNNVMGMGTQFDQTNGPAVAGSHRPAYRNESRRLGGFDEPLAAEASLMCGSFADPALKV